MQKKVEIPILRCQEDFSPCCSKYSILYRNCYAISQNFTLKNIRRMILCEGRSSSGWKISLWNLKNDIFSNSVQYGVFENKEKIGRSKGGA
jgi:putative component of membrane protein insertase Oxa1/YidC/SpoIIIJ protein YidD